MKHSIRLYIKPDFLIYIGFHWLVNIAVFLSTANSQQCCDAEGYQNEANLINTLGVIPSGGTTWLTFTHNYLYALFIHFISIFGLASRWPLTILQFIFVMIPGSIILAKSWKNQEKNRVAIGLLITVLSLFLNYNFTGYRLTEGISSGLLLLFCYLLISNLHSLKLPDSFYQKFVLLVLIASLLWMLRPSFSWLLLVTLGVVTLLTIFNNTISLSRRLFQSSTFFIIASIVSLPQIFIAKRSIIDSLFHVSDYTNYIGPYSGVLRYITNLTGCGPNPMLFSPYGNLIEEINPDDFVRNPITLVSIFVTRVVSGWDAFPSSLTYVTSFGFFPELIITLLSGIIFASPFMYAFVTLKQNISFYHKLIQLFLPFLFLISQLTSGMTHGEFRYNIVGWVLGFFALMGILRQKMDIQKYLALGLIGLLFSFFFLVVGQLTLLSSDPWKECMLLLQGVTN